MKKYLLPTYFDLLKPETRASELLKLVEAEKNQESREKVYKEAFSRLITTIEVAYSEDGIYGVSTEKSLENVWKAAQEINKDLKNKLKYK